MTCTKRMRNLSKKFDMSIAISPRFASCGFYRTNITNQILILDAVVFPACALKVDDWSKYGLIIKSPTTLCPALSIWVSHSLHRTIGATTNFSPGCRPISCGKDQWEIAHVAGDEFEFFRCSRISTVIAKPDFALGVTLSDRS